MGVRDGTTGEVLYHTVPSMYAYMMSGEGSGFLPFADGTFVEHSVRATPQGATSLSIIMDFRVKAEHQSQVLKKVMTDPNHCGRASLVEFHQPENIPTETASGTDTEAASLSLSGTLAETANDYGGPSTVLDMIRTMIPFDVPLYESR